MKCLEKPWALKSASINSLTSNSGSSDDDSIGEINSLEKFVQAATESIRVGQYSGSSEDILKDRPYNLFIDLAHPFSERLSNLKYMMRNENNAYIVVKSGLSRGFDRLYTKCLSPTRIFRSGSRKDWLTQLPRSILGYPTFAAIALFHRANKEEYSNKDIKVTYILLCCTIIVELLGPNVQSICEAVDLVFGLPWPDDVSQYNLIGYLAQNKKHKNVRKLATLLVCKGYLDHLWCMKPSRSSQDITKIVHHHITAAWKHKIVDASTYRQFHNTRGQWSLLDGDCTQLEWSLRRPFHKSVLLWHLATEFCFYHTDTLRETSSVNKTAHRCRKMSNYMAYQLFVSPEMLMAGTRRSLFRNAYLELKDFLKDEDPTLHSRELTKKITQLLQDNCPHEQAPGASSSRQSFSRSAWELAEALLRIPDREKMWRVIRGVWVEMLCFSAGRCRGYLHAKSLGKGGEYLSYVWLLLSYTGMATSAEILQRTELQYEGDLGAANPTPVAANTAGENNV
ncbi:hypothetical protein QOZ80_9AG0684890 [Eleusine coracana subsp. coracana]|nr:hypothetical protein QOZ80_9AG0684890 [Eleusine coracana subsp. coracana]